MWLNARTCMSGCSWYSAKGRGVFRRGNSISKRLYRKALGHQALYTISIEDDMQNLCANFFQVISTWEVWCSDAWESISLKTNKWLYSWGIHQGKNSFKKTSFWGKGWELEAMYWVTSEICNGNGEETCISAFCGIPGMFYFSSGEENEKFFHKNIL